MDIALAAIGLLLSLPFLLLALVLIKVSSPGAAVFAQDRVGRHRQIFTCYKLRTMRKDTPNAASHEVSRSAVTAVGHLLRRTKLDELPQLWNVLTGDMSLVGPRPCLPSQAELIEARHERGLYACRPGITGPAQIEGVDMSDPQRLARLDEAWIQNSSVSNYFHIIGRTVAGAGRGDRTI